MPGSPANVDEILKRVDPFIQAQVSKQFPRRIVPPELLDLEKDEIMQQVRFKLWQAMMRDQIKHEKAYIKRIIRTSIVDLIRCRQKTVRLLDEEEQFH